MRCIAESFGPIDTKPLQELATALAADDIRRGHIVTPGKFTPNAIKLAEEKQITLLPGDVFLEKLNALPTAARAEIMKVINAGA